MGKKVKNKDLAEKLGVSGTLVSLVLNNKADQHGIRKDTQEKVLALARQMGYFDHLKGKQEISPVEEKPGIIGMIVPSLQDPFIYGITPFLQKAFSSIGVGFSIITKTADDKRYGRMINAFKKFYTGLILYGEAADEYTIRSLRASSYPFVLLEKSVKSFPLNSVCSDLSEGSKRVADHIEKMGYKNIIIVTCSKRSAVKSNFPPELIRNVLSTKQNINKSVIVELDYPVPDYDIDFDPIEKYMRPPYRAEILVVTNSDLIYPLMALLRDKKLRIPQDIALISMEDGIAFDLLYSPVTSLRRPLSAMALKIANMIWSEVKNAGKGKYKRQVNLSPELIIRNSCGTF